MEEHYGVRREEKWDIWSPSFNACSFFDPCSATAQQCNCSQSAEVYFRLYSITVSFSYKIQIYCRTSKIPIPWYNAEFGHFWRENSNILGLKRHCSLAPRVTTQPQVVSTKLDAFFLVSGDGRTIISSDTEVCYYGFYPRRKSRWI